MVDWEIHFGVIITMATIIPVYQVEKASKHYQERSYGSGVDLTIQHLSTCRPGPMSSYL